MHACSCVYSQDKRKLFTHLSTCVPSRMLVDSFPFSRSMSSLTGLVFRGMDQVLDLEHGAYVKGNVVEFPGFTSARRTLMSPDPRLHTITIGAVIF